MNRGWQITGTLLALFILLPLAVLFLGVWGESSDSWTHLRKTVLTDYIINTLILVLGTAVLTLILGVSTAWAVSAYSFRGRRFFEWALVLPLAIPTYIVAYTYSGIFDYTGVVQTFTRNVLGWKTDALVPFEIMSMPGAILVISLVLYPYVYLISRASFLHQSRNLLEASRLLGKGSLTTFFRIAIPAARPAIVGGVSLVIMEVLNDYGAVKYYGISTFTTGIFRTWFSLGDLTGAIRLAMFLLIGVLVLLALERWQRGKKRYESTSKSRPLAREQLKGWKALLVIVVCLIPFLFGFGIPVLQLLAWAGEQPATLTGAEFWTIAGNTFQVASVVAIITVAIALLMAYAKVISHRQKNWGLDRLATIGYAIPGAVIAVGVMLPFRWLDEYTSLFLMGTLLALIYACVVRFLAVAYNSVEAGFTKIGQPMQEASTSLGASPWRTLWKINMPLLRPSLLAAFMLVFVDVLKELPLTLILRPFNFDTLATKAYELASDEQLDASAVYALTIIAIGLIPILVLNRLLRK